MSFEVVTYANKSLGMFEELVNNEFDIPIKVLGWGTKWNGFSDKYKGMHKYLENKNDDDIIIFLDGFDTKINKNPRDVLELFNKYNCKVLVSKDPVPYGIFSRMIFGTCKGKTTANSGLYMGYVKYVKQFINEAINMKCEDDQTNLNILCEKFEYIKVDEDEKIFKNFSSFQKNKTSDAIFVSYPGTFGIERYLRGLFEYTQFVYMYILCVLILGLALFPQYKRILSTLLISVLSFYIFFADKSCTTDIKKQILK
tara:strand:+ start:65 stop:829 length:765 start_codon:yes stop_codon:yes gene_type:complete